MMFGAARINGQSRRRGRTPVTVSVLGNAAISTGQSKFGGSSIFFDGDDDQLEIALGGNLQADSLGTNGSQAITDHAG
jgi:hypothetical protein